MSKRATIMGTACVFAAAALTAGPAVAAALTGFAGSLTTGLSNTDSEATGTEAVKSWLLGGSLAGPLPDLLNLNFEANAAFRHNWADDFSQEDWFLGASLFWAGDMSRVGINGTYATFTHGGQITNGGVFGEYYLGQQLTAMAKGGWLTSTGTFGGHGNYWGGAVTGYMVPNLAITGSVDWGKLIVTQGCQTCGREGVRISDFEISGEFLFLEEMGLSGYLGYVYEDQKILSFNGNDNIIRVGLRWYTGAGPLVDRHRNGNLNPWLPGVAMQGR